MEKRRHVIVGLFVLAMLLTPPDITTQILMAVPLILLYEFCIWFLYFTEGKKAKLSPPEKPEPESEDELNKEK
jgi:sec-independent protein translocase protein TatC